MLHFKSMLEVQDLFKSAKKTLPQRSFCFVPILKFLGSVTGRSENWLNLLILIPHFLDYVGLAHRVGSQMLFQGKTLKQLLGEKFTNFD